MLFRCIFSDDRVFFFRYVVLFRFSIAGDLLCFFTVFFGFFSLVVSNEHGIEREGGRGRKGDSKFVACILTSFASIF